MRAGIKYLICYFKGHNFKKFRAPLNINFSWIGWVEWSGIKCTRCYKKNFRRINKEIK